MNNENIFLKHKLLLGLFFITFFVFMYFHYKFSLGLFFDMPAMFLADISHDYDFSNFIMFHDNRIRLFSNLLVAIPFNISLLFVKNQPAINALKFFSLSYFIIHFLGLLMNYLIARRTKRYDIAAICFAFYTFFSIQNALWACREVHITIMFFFALLSYFISKEKLGRKDIIPIVLIIIYLFESFEISMVFGLILFIFSVLYTKTDRTEQNRWYKAIIGTGGLLVFLYIPLKMLFWSITSNMDLNQGVSEYITGSLLTLKFLFKTNSIITFFALIALIFIMFYKKPLNKKSIPFFIISIAGILYFIKVRTNFISLAGIEITNYSWIFWFIFPTIIALILFDYFNKDINKEFVSNLVILSCLTGILGLGWQIHSCFEFNKYTSYIKDLMSKSQETFVKIPEKDFSDKSFLNFHICFGTMHSSILLSEDNKIDKIIVPAEYYPGYGEACFDFSEKDKNYYDKENEILYLQTAPFKLKNKYWDLSKIKEEMENKQINN